MSAKCVLKKRNKAVSKILIKLYLLKNYMLKISLQILKINIINGERLIELIQKIN